MNSFFLMGCWNSDQCNTLDYRTAVVKQILQDKKASRYTFGVIAGDNIYQQNKVYHLKTLQYGFGLMEPLKVPLYTLLGNHDVHKKEILTGHLDLVKQKKIIMPRHCYTVVYPNLRMIILDTNLLTSKKSKDTTYQELLQEHPDFFSIPTGDDLVSYLRTELEKPFDGWTLVIGHEPFLSININRSGNLKVRQINHYDTITQLLLASPRTLYLCADVHAFQAMNVPVSSESLNTTVPMVVVGTGGASPDHSPDEKTPIPIPTRSQSRTSPGSASLKQQPGSASLKPGSASPIASPVSFYMEGTSPSYGYVSVSYSATKLFVHFHPLKGCTDGQSEMVFECINGQLELKKRTKISLDASVCPAHPAEEGLCPKVGGRRKKKDI